MKSETYYSAVILFVATFVLVIGILAITEPESMKDKKSKSLAKWKMVLFTSVVSLIFSLSISYLSEKIDSISEKRK